MEVYNLELKSSVWGTGEWWFLYSRMDQSVGQKCLGLGLALLVLVIYQDFLFIG